MSSWTSLLESLHSALIDELVEAHPEPKPELGLPLRQNRFALPSAELGEVLFVDVTFELVPQGPGTKGIALLASDSGFMRGIKSNSATLWKAMLKRTPTEFARRQLAPRFSMPQILKASDSFPVSALQCGRVIWIPVRIPAGRCFFGVGV